MAAHVDCFRRVFCGPPPQQGLLTINNVNVPAVEIERGSRVAPLVTNGTPIRYVLRRPYQAGCITAVDTAVGTYVARHSRMYQRSQ